MDFYTVIQLLNSGKSLQEVADELKMRVSVLEDKLSNAAVVLENGVWKYIGNSADKSLSRNVKNRIKVLKDDEEFVKRKKVIKNQNENHHHDLAYDLHLKVRSLDVSKLTDKKSIFFIPDLYADLKKISKENSYKINVLINILLMKGLEFYFPEYK
jgi:hypothetical protein